MRFVVLLLGFLGILLSGAMGFMFLCLDTVLSMVKDTPVDFLDLLQTSPTGMQLNDTGLLLVLAAFYGMIGTLLGFLRCGKQGGVMLLLPVLFCAIMNPYSLAFTWAQALAGLLSFFVSPLPINAPEMEKEEDSED